MTELDERSDELDIDEWITTKMATKKDLYWWAVIIIVATSLITILIKLFSIALALEVG